MKKILITCISFLCFSIVHAGCDLEDLVGWTIIEVKTISGYKDSGKEQKDDWEGCDFDRRVFFMDGTTVTCTSYNYQYAYMPKAVILGTNFKYKGKNRTMLKMCVDGEMIDIGNY